jgi:L-alanine-DL-glutamate epimerase-like enolase superfamily enzyme
MRNIAVRNEKWPIRGSFRIARGAKTDAEVIVVEIAEGGAMGQGECVPYGRYGETIESVLAQIAGIADAVSDGMTRLQLQIAMPPGAARNAIDCALIDLEAKLAGRPAHAILGLPEPKPVATAFTLSLDTPAAMAGEASAAVDRGHQLLKLKVGGSEDIARVRAVRAAAPSARLIVDANEGWSLAELKEVAPALADLGVGLIEQPLKASEDERLQDFVSPVPLCADESCHTSADLARLAGLYRCVNVKLDKAGGLTEALALTRAASEFGLILMVGCMVATSLSMAPAMLLGGFADYVDLDGPLLLERDRTPGLTYKQGIVYPPQTALWG